MSNSNINVIAGGWMTERDAATYVGVTKRTIRNYRVKGHLKRWRILPTGRGIQYSVKELDKLFTKSQAA